MGEENGVERFVFPRLAKECGTRRDFQAGRLVYDLVKVRPSSETAHTDKPSVGLDP